MSIPQPTVTPTFDRNLNRFAACFWRCWPLVVTLLCGGVLTPASAQNFTNLHNFIEGNDGAAPWARLVLSGNTLYGTTEIGGSLGDGVVFKVNTNGVGFTTLHSFNYSDGYRPRAGLVLSGDALYGTTFGGGSSGQGTVFRINTDGTGFTNLLNFTGGNDGGNPWAVLILSGNTLYGTTSGGGNSGYGAVFAINTNGTSLTNLHSFSTANYPFTNSDGAEPKAGLVLSGNVLYGATSSGGSSGEGVVFAVNTDGSDFTNLYSFAGGSGGASPNCDLILSGNTLFGTTGNGGSSDNGSIFLLNTDGTGFTNLYSFKATDAYYGTNSDGAIPLDGLVLSGNTLYGTARWGAISGRGSVFAVHTDGTRFTNLYSFSASSGPFFFNADGANPIAGLVLSGNALYGTAQQGGASGGGTVFRIGLPAQPNQPPVAANPISNLIGIYGGDVNLTFPANTFSDPDAGQTLTYTVSNLPPGITFDGSTRAFSGTPTDAGLYTVTITATDNGLPPLNTNDVFNIVVDKALLTISVTSTNRLYGEANPALTGTLTGVTNDDNIVALFSIVATSASPPGNYPVIPAFLDPDNRLGNYLVTTNSGTLTVNNVTLAISSINGVLTFSWPTNAGAFLPEYTDDLTPPVLWHSVTNGITTNGANIYLTVVPEVAVPARFYRLQLPACVDNNDKLGIFPPHSDLYGKSYGEWAAAFWQWAFALPLDGHPFLDSPNDPISTSGRANRVMSGSGHRPTVR